jgi:chromosome segregation ATPase
VAAFVLLLFLPNPMNAVIQEQAAFQNRLTRQIAAINQVRTTINNQTEISAQERAMIEKILREALAQLQKANNEGQAQQTLAQAQAKLDQLRDPQASSKAQALANASSSLQNSSNANVSAAGKALAKGDKQALDSSLQKLASQLTSMSSAQRAQLAKQLEQSANQAQGNPQLSSALHQLAKAVADGNSSEISDAVKALETAAAQESANQGNTSGIDKASQALQNAADKLATATDSGSGQNSSQTQAPGQGQTPGQTQSPSQGQGISGQSGQNNTGTRPGKNEQVYVPGQVGSGTSNISVDGNNGTVQPGNPVPYSQVIAQYTQMAHDAVDNSNIPPDLKDLIRGYFNSLEGRQ